MREHTEGRIGYFALTIPSIITLLFSCQGCNRPTKIPPQQSNFVAPPVSSPLPLSANDVSILFPAPITSADLEKLIVVSDLTTPDLQDPAKRDPVWPDVIFQQFLAIAQGPPSQVDGTGTGISLPDEAKTPKAWFVAGIRIDAGAPGLAAGIRDQFGSLPEIRLIIQPITRNSDGSPKVLDIAGHLIFDFILSPVPAAQSVCAPRQSPDRDAFNSIVSDLNLINSKLRNGQLGGHQISTANAPLGVHPAFRDPATALAFRDEIKSFLEKHLSSQRLDAMSIAGLPGAAPVPWIFLSMTKIAGGLVPQLPNGGFVPVHGPTLDGQQFAQMLQPVGIDPRVVPNPGTNNLNPANCRNAAVSAASLPIEERKGVATAELLTKLLPPSERARQILDVVSDPTQSHFFNTDCISCHTETRLAMDILNVKTVEGIDPAALPNGPWDIRNFGWSPSANGPQATVTRRTANETAAVVAFINSQALNK